MTERVFAEWSVCPETHWGRLFPMASLRFGQMRICRRQSEVDGYTQPRESIVDLSMAKRRYVPSRRRPHLPIPDMHVVPMTCIVDVVSLAWFAMPACANLAAAHP